MSRLRIGLFLLAFGSALWGGALGEWSPQPFLGIILVAVGIFVIEGALEK